MDKLQVVYYAVFSKQDQGIKSYWSFLCKVLSQYYFSNILILIAVLYESQNKNFWGIDIFCGEMIQKSRVKLQGKTVSNTNWCMSFLMY